MGLGNLPETFEERSSSVSGFNGSFAPSRTWDTAAYVYSACLPFFSLKAGYAGEGMKRTVFCSAFTYNNSSCCSLCLLSFFNSLQPSPAPFSHCVLEQHLHPPPPRNGSRAWGETVTLCSRYGTAAGKLTWRNSSRSAKIRSYLSKRDYENQFTISEEQPESSSRTKGVPSWNLHSIHQKRVKVSSQPHRALTAQVRWIKGLKWWLVPAICKLGQKESVQTWTMKLFSLRDIDPNSSEH